MVKVSKPIPFGSVGIPLSLVRRYAPQVKTLESTPLVHGPFRVSRLDIGPELVTVEVEMG